MNERSAPEGVQMPWKPEDAPGHTRKADTVRLCETWSEVANKTLAEIGDEGRAVRIANAVVARDWARIQRQLKRTIVT
jgi:hypothetical protein